MGKRGTDSRQMDFAVVLSGIRYDSQARVMEGILDAAREHGDRVVLLSCDTWGYMPKSYGDGETNIFSLLNPSLFDGIIFHGDTIGSVDDRDRLARKILRSKVPAISLNNMIPGMLYKALDNVGGVQEIARHLISVRGARKINYIAGPSGNNDSEERLEALREVLEEEGLGLEPLQICRGDYHPQSGAVAVQKWLGAGRENMPDAIICANDEMALGAIDELIRQGIRVPEDIAVTGFDNAYSGQIHKPSITTVIRHDYELGLEALRNLREFILTGDAGRTDPIKCNVIFRESSEIAESIREQYGMVFRDRASEPIDRGALINYVELFKSTITGFSTANGYDELFRAVRKYAKLLNINDFCLCLSKDQPQDDNDSGPSSGGSGTRLITEYGSVMTVPVAMVGGKTLSCKDFPTREMLPSEFVKAVPGAFFEILPVHYLNRSYGYAVVLMETSSVFNYMFNMFAMSVGNAIEDVFKQTQLTHMVDKLNKLYIYDSLTGVMNRSGFNKHADTVLRNASEDGLDICIFFIDLDNLKYINDNLGHDDGDKFIQAAAGILEHRTRHGELLMRYGGDEFVALVPGMNEEEAQERIRLVHEDLEAENIRREWKSDDIAYDMSIGYIIVPREEVSVHLDLDVKIEEADQEMYVVKKMKKEKQLRNLTLIQ